jgi:hypothetical protein
MSAFTVVPASPLSSSDFPPLTKTLLLDWLKKLHVPAAYFKAGASEDQHEKDAIAMLNDMRQSVMYVWMQHLKRHACWAPIQYRETTVRIYVTQGHKWTICHGLKDHVQEDLKSPTGKIDHFTFCESAPLTLEELRSPLLHLLEKKEEPFSRAHLNTLNEMALLAVRIADDIHAYKTGLSVETMTSFKGLEAKADPKTLVLFTALPQLSPHAFIVHLNIQRGLPGPATDEIMEVLKKPLV